MSASANATTDPSFGLINGYAPAPVASPLGFGEFASVITVHPSDIVQFYNFEDFFPSAVLHSAIGFQSVSTFPPVPFHFTSSEQTGTAISATQAWSTGLLAAFCYSQTFTVSGTGPIFFGDFNYYTLTNMRDVIVVSTTPSIGRKPLSGQRRIFARPGT